MKKILLVCLCSILTFSTSYSQSINPDNSFGSSGKVTVPIQKSDHANFSFIQPDGKIVVAASTNVTNETGDFTVLRLLPNGAPDPNFAGTGKLIVPFGLGKASAFEAVVRDDGKILVAGTYSPTGEPFDAFFALARINSDGTLDNSFDEDGKLLIEVGTERDQLREFQLMEDGKMILAGHSYNPSLFDWELSVVRLNENGSFDNSFSGDGKMILPNPDYHDAMNALIVQPDGKILLGGKTGSEASDDFLVVRINADGSMDDTFDGDGKVIVSVGETDNCGDMVMDEEGKIFLAGSSSQGGINHYSLLSLDPNGSLNNNFSQDGKLMFSLGDRFDEATAILIKGGKLLIGGQGKVNNERGIALVRLDMKGNFDMTFDGDGIMINTSGEYLETLLHMVFQQDGKLLLSGASLVLDPYEENILLRRYTYPVVASIQDNQHSENYFSVYPNPSKGYLTIQCQETTGTMHVTDALGRPVQKISLTENNQNYPLSNLSPGLYLLMLYSEGKTFLGTKKVVVEQP